MTAVIDEELPPVTAVFLSYNRKDQLREALQRMRDGGYPAGRLDLVVVDNASSDGTEDMLRRDFADVAVVQTGANLGAPGWNQGFAVARGDYVVILDDDAYLPSGALEQAVRAAVAEDAGLVSFKVVSSFDEDYLYNDEYQTGLLSYWGCAALVSRAALDELGGYDPNIFIWGNELEFTMRLLDRGYTHLFLPDVTAVHMKKPVYHASWTPRAITHNCRHWGYVAGKLMRPLDAVLAASSIAALMLIEGLIRDRTCLRGVLPLWGGFVTGVRNRAPVRPEVSRTYRRHFHSFGWPWRYWRSPLDRLRARRGEDVGAQRDRARGAYFEQRLRFYPLGRATLRL